ncbi:DMT family transporter [Microbulbifer sp. MKSA007]|nr:DMT family transporter [Microbulbifer sp. MKSA007]
MPSTYQNHSLGVGLALLGGVLMGCLGIAGKLGSGAGLSPFLLLAAQVILLAPLSGMFLLMRQGVAGIRPVNPQILVLRSISGFVYFAAFYWAVKGIPIADALVLESTNPFFAMLMARVFLGHRVSIATIFLAILAFLGVCLILIQHSVQGIFNPYSLLALLAGVARAAGSITTGVAGRTEPPERIMFYFAVGMLVFSLSIVFWEDAKVETSSLWILAIPALLFVPQNLAYTIANRVAPAYLVGALFYSAILVGVLADRFMFDTEFGIRGVIGMGITVAAGLGLAWLRAKELKE